MFALVANTTFPLLYPLLWSLITSGDQALQRHFTKIITQALPLLDAMFSGKMLAKAKPRKFEKKTNGKICYNRTNSSRISKLLCVPNISLNKAINCLMLPQWCLTKHFCDESKVVMNT